MSRAELACTYASLLLADDDVAVTGEKIQTVLKAANIDVEPYWPTLFAKALEGITIKTFISNVGTSVGAAPAAAVPDTESADAGGSAGGKKAEVKKKEESEEEEDDDMGFGLFD